MSYTPILQPLKLKETQKIKNIKLRKNLLVERPWQLLRHPQATTAQPAVPIAHLPIEELVVV